VARRSCSYALALREFSRKFVVPSGDMAVVGCCPGQLVLWLRADSCSPGLKIGLRGGQCYEELLDKFSGSASLHHDYANFCETVLNDEARAIKYRQGADILESGHLVPSALSSSLSASNQTLAYRFRQLAMANSQIKGMRLISLGWVALSPPPPTVNEGEHIRGVMSTVLNLAAPSPIRIRASRRQWFKRKQHLGSWSQSVAKRDTSVKCGAVLAWQGLLARR
jgi:hypothetical protein